MKPFPSISEVELFLSGGAVRDELLGIESKDRDFVMITDLSLEEIANKITSSGNIVYRIRPEFQAILARVDHENIDFVFPREECRYSNSRHPDSTKKIKDLRTDSTRRDFTINSMYMDSRGQLYDYQNGRKDLEDKIVRCVGLPSERFNEDPLRILRAIRLAVTLGFNIDHETYDEMCFNKELLARPSVSLERIKSEVNRALAANPLKTLQLIEEMDLMPIILIKDSNFRIELSNRR